MIRLNKLTSLFRRSIVGYFNKRTSNSRVCNLYAIYTILRTVPRPYNVCTGTAYSVRFWSVWLLCSSPCHIVHQFVTMSMLRVTWNCAWLQTYNISVKNNHYCTAKLHGYMAMILLKHYVWAIRASVTDAGYQTWECVM